jgi:hypothetical protein
VNHISAALALSALFSVKSDLLFGQRIGFWVMEDGHLPS